MQPDSTSKVTSKHKAGLFNLKLLYFGEDSAGSRMRKLVSSEDCDFLENLIFLCVHLLLLLIRWFYLLFSILQCAKQFALCISEGLLIRLSLRIVFAF